MTSPHRRLLGAVVLLLLGSPARTGDFWKPFLAGAASGFVLHEASHLGLDLAFDTKPRLKGVRFGSIPFFAVTHDANTPRGQEALISGAGFVSQHLGSEIALSRRPAVQPFSSFNKGVLAFHVATSVAYADAALARYGPFERDTRGIADATGTDERLIGVLVLAPAVFDSWRYLRPQSRAARWGSRLSKATFMAIIAFKN